MRDERFLIFRDVGCDRSHTVPTNEKILDVGKIIDKRLPSSHTNSVGNARGRWTKRKTDFQKPKFEHTLCG